MKSGDNLVIFMGKIAKNLNEIFEGANFWKLDNLFSPTEVLNENYVKNNVITDEDFMAKADFKLTLLISGNYQSLD